MLCENPKTNVAAIKQLEIRGKFKNLFFSSCNNGINLTLSFRTRSGIQLFCYVLDTGLRNLKSSTTGMTSQ